MSGILPDPVNIEYELEAACGGAVTDQVVCVVPYDATITAITLLDETGGALGNNLSVECEPAGGGTETSIVAAVNPTTVAFTEFALTLVTANVDVTAGSLITVTAAGALANCRLMTIKLRPQ